MNPDLQALWIRIYDEAHNPREFHKINPDGSEGPLRTTVDGEPERVAWGSLSEIGKSVKILGDGSRDNISKSLGFSHKIRNFFNNIIEPNSPRQDLTADTHAVAAAQLRPLSGNSPEVKKNFGGIMHAMSGTKGTYALYADAYREAAKDLDIPYARSLQSIVWEKIRSEFPADIKSKENLGGIDSIWKEYTDGQISKREAQDAIFEAARGYRDQAFGGGGDASDQGKLFEPSVSGESTAGNGGGRGGNSTSGSLGKRGGVSKGAIDALSFINMMKAAGENDKAYLFNPRAEAMRDAPVYKDNPEYFKQQYGSGQEWYHGTTADFEDFKHEGVERGTTDWNSHLGTHFTADSGVAQIFADGRYSGKTEGGRVIPARLNIQNPKAFQFEGDMGDAALASALKNEVVTLDEVKRVKPDFDPSKTYHEGNSVINALKNKRNAIGNNFKKDLKNQGYDGITYGNVVEGGFGNPTAIAFEPEQIEQIKHLNQKGAFKTGAAALTGTIAGAALLAANQGNKDEDNTPQPQPRAEARTVAQRLLRTFTA